jgi:hypothetical protein
VFPIPQKIQSAARGDLMREQVDKRHSESRVKARQIAFLIDIEERTETEQAEVTRQVSDPESRSVSYVQEKIDVIRNRRIRAGDEPTRILRR